MKTHLEYEETLGLLLSGTPSASSSVSVPLFEACGRVAAADLCAVMDQPPFPRSPLDGTAFRSADTVNASAASPVRLTVDRTILAGDGGDYRVEPGHACRIMTGARLPLGTDCVARQEDTAVQDGVVAIPRCYRPQENYCFAGEDVAKGCPILTKGQRLTPAHVGVLAAQGFQQVPVYRTPVVGVLSTGSELAVPGTSLAPGQIYDSNSYTLSAMLRELGAHVRKIPPQPDRLEALTETLDTLLRDCDAVMTTGGVSVGQADLMPAAAQALGGRLLFHRVNVKPGTPVMAMVRDNTPLLALSGNPHAALVTFALFGAPMVRKLSGLPERDCWQSAVMEADFRVQSRASLTRRFVRAVLSGGRVRIPEGNRSPGALFGSLGCNCLIDVSAGVEMLHAGDSVRALPLGGGEP